MGLPTPLAVWLRTSEREVVREYVDDAARRHGEVFRGDVVRELLKAHVAREVDSSKLLFMFIASVMWLDRLAQESRSADFWSGGGSVAEARRSDGAA